MSLTKVSYSLIAGSPLNIVDFGAVCDGVTDDTAYVIAAMDAAIGPTTIYIPANTVWDFLTAESHLKDDTTIYDCSGYDFLATNNFAGQVRYITKTGTPGSKNANNFIMSSPYHPAIVIEPLGDGSDASNRASIVYARRGTDGVVDRTWQAFSDTHSTVGPDIKTLYTIKDGWSEPDRTCFQIIGGDTSANEMGFNVAASNGIAYYFASRYVGTAQWRFEAKTSADDILFSTYGGATEYGRLWFRTTGVFEYDNRISSLQGAETFKLTDTTAGATTTFYRVANGGGNVAATGLKMGYNSVTGRTINAGGTINASGADYAEYMEKAGDFTLAKGDICGINADGKLTNVFADAITFVVKSTNPSYVGNDSWGTKSLIDPGDKYTDAELQSKRQAVDRIAFAGQVPVNVLGAAAGQYIIPTNDNGTIKGEAISNPTFEQYQSAVGKVIAIEADGRARIIVKIA